MNMNLKLAAAALLFLAGMAGCTPNQKTDTPAEQTGVQVKEGARNTGEAADRAGDSTANRAEGAFNELKKDSKEALAVLKVKNAFITHGKIDADNINVDGKEMTIHLRGSVATAGEKKLAEDLAKKTAGPEFKLMSHLQVNKAKKGAE